MVTPYTALSPNVVGKSQEQAKTIKSWNRQYNQFTSGAARTRTGLLSLEEQSQDAAIQKVMEDHPDAPIEEKKRLVKVYYGIAHKKTKRHLDAQKIAYADAAKGTYFTPTDVLGTPEQQEAQASGYKPWTKTESQGRQEMLRQADTPEEKLRAVQAPTDELNVAPYNKPGAPLLDLIMEKKHYGTPEKMYTESGRGALGTINYGLGYTSRGAQGFWGSLEGQARDATEHVPIKMGEESVSRYHGIPMKEAAYVALTNPGKVLGALSQAWEDSWEAAHDESKEHDISVFLKGQSARYKKAAIDITIAEVKAGSIKREDAKGRFAEVFDELVENDLGEFALNNPDATQFMFELVVDPLNLVGGSAAKLGTAIAKAMSKTKKGTELLQMAGKVKAAKDVAVKGALDSLKETQGVQAIRAVANHKRFKDTAQAARKFTDQFRHMPEMKRFAKLSEEAAQSAQLARVSDAQSLSAARKFGADASKLMGVIGKVKHPKDKEKLMELLEMRLPVSYVRTLVPKEIKAAFEAGVEIREKAWKWSKLAGLTKWHKMDDSGVEILVETQKRKGYVPHYVFDVEGKPRIVDEVRRRKLQSASSKGRRGTEHATRDVYKQWDAWLSENLPKQRLSLQLRKTDKAMRKGKFVREIADPKLADEMVDSLNSVSDMSWVKLEGDLADEYALFTGKKGARKGAGAVVVPEHYRDLMLSWKPMVSLDTLDPQAAQVLMGLGKAIKGYQQTWRWFATVPNPAFSVRNFMGGFGLSTIALGTRALNPELQGKAIAASMLAAAGDPKAMAKARSIEFTLRSGKKTTLDRVIKSAEKLGLTSQLEEKMIAGLAGRGRVGRALEDAASIWNVKGVRYLSPAYMARMTENYQHLVAYMGVLDDLTPKGIADAFDFANKFSGNYSQLGRFERGVIREGVGFYAWSRFILPHMARQLIENPHRLAAWVKARGGMERYYGANAPFSGRGTPGYLRAWGMTAPEGQQPWNHVPKDEDGNLKYDSHEFAMMMMENPLAMGFAILPAFTDTAMGGLGRESIHDLLGPAAHIFFEIMTRRDVNTGQELGAFFDASGFPEFAASQVGQVITEVAYRPTKTFSNLIELYRQRDMKVEEIDLRLRYAVGRQLMGVDNLAAKAFGIQPLSLGGMFDALGEGATGVPGAFMYPVDPMREAVSTQRRAGKRIYKESEEMKKVPEIFHVIGGNE